MTGLQTALLPADWAPTADTLRERVILVTGASGGLGSAVARAAAGAGATVVLVGRRVKAMEKLYDELLEAGAAQPAICPLNLENATPRDFAGLADTIERELGRLDGVVHAAARFDGLTPMEAHAPDEWLRVLQVNLSAPFAMQQALQPLLKAAPDGATVFVLDDPERMRKAHWGAYGVAKAGVEAMVAILHDELENSSLRVHALLPGPMRTALRRMAWFGEDTLKHPTPDGAAAATVYLLSADGAAARGRVLDLR